MLNLNISDYYSYRKACVRFYESSSYEVSFMCKKILHDMVPL
jgi:hypothetical protein